MTDFLIVSHYWKLLVGKWSYADQYEDLEPRWNQPKHSQVTTFFTILYYQMVSYFVTFPLVCVTDSGRGSHWWHRLHFYRDLKIGSFYLNPTMGLVLHIWQGIWCSPQNKSRRVNSLQKKKLVTYSYWHMIFIMTITSLKKQVLSKLHHRKFHHVILKCMFHWFSQDKILVDLSRQDSCLTGWDPHSYQEKQDKRW